MQHSKIGRSTSGVGQKQRGPSEPVAGACPKCPESRHSSMMAADGSHGPAGSRGSGGRAQRGMGCDASISLSPVEAAWPRQAARAARWRVILGRRHLGDGPPRQEPPAASTPLFWSTPGSRRRKGAEAAQSGWVAGSPWFCSGARRRGVSP